MIFEQLEKIGLDEDTRWEIVGAGSALLAGFAVRSLIKNTWRLVSEEEPPDNPASPDVSWGKAIIMTALTGMLVGVGRLAARRLATSVWKQEHGSEPEAVKTRQSDATIG